MIQSESPIRAYALSEEDVLDGLETAAEGLTQAQADRRLEKYGPNEIAFRKTPAWLRFLRQFNDPMVIILLLTAAVTGVLTALGSHMLPDTIVIVSVVVLNAVLGFVQEGKAEGALDALRNMMVPECLVLRDGERQRLPSRLLVPGDIVVLEAGDKIPADLRFIDVSNLHVDESSLTGESVPVEKITAALSGESLVPGDQRNIGFSGTYVSQGTGRAAVFATGGATAFGQIADMVKSAGNEATPLQRKLQEFVRSLIFAILAVGAFNFILGIYLGYAISYSFLGAVSLVVAAIPEMLPALVTSVLALSGVVMARRKALIRRLPAAETLGATSVICSDKTGTLTENRMTVTRVYAGGQIFTVSGGSKTLEGTFSLDGPVSVPDHLALQRVLEVGYDCNDARVHGGDAIGDPTEVALRVAGVRAGLITAGVRRIEEMPFDSSTKFMAVLVDRDGQRCIYVKGAPEVVLGMCDQEIDERGDAAPLREARVSQTATAFASDALRTLGFAFKVVAPDKPDLRIEDLEGLCFAGLQGMIDPPKQSAIEAVAACRQAGIRTVMITGDHPGTAQAVAHQLGIDGAHVLTGVELSVLSEDALRETVEKVSVYARVAPEHKKAIAEALKANGHVVAMTGDGVNDAPALKAADIGIAMGVGGTEVAKEAADMVLEDDNFATIVAAVEEGRHAWNNLQKAILYTLPTNAAQALLILGAVSLASLVPLFSARFVLEPVQILWVNLLDSVLLTMPLMLEAKERGLLLAPPRAADTHIIDTLFLQRVLALGLAIALPGFLVYYYFGSAAVNAQGEIIDALLLTQAQTAAFWGILLAHFGYLVSARSVRRSAFTFNPFGNRWLLGGIMLSVLIRLIPTLVPEAAALFRTAPFPMDWWPVILLCFLPSFIVIESDKFLRTALSSKPR
ncbi:cation-translocating P-type ATPase [Congregibacter litoralis]|uniref:ATPase, P-type (Transporting), HAD superfamily, subfamily IC n=1 Tax=Congregibacter litoralis KT71 TaxID=314285 RepID=A4AD19_9GAMM|nr:HAD-IC family P-type ATPase [Congregibacter litoralis]EAQ96072.1 ATPase, P-type (transporting), HAD superfamily, subfamily IC [Congregibacter litoralis KT71]